MEITVSQLFHIFFTPLKQYYIKQESVVSMLKYLKGFMKRSNGDDEKASIEPKPEVIFRYPRKFYDKCREGSEEILN